MDKEHLGIGVIFLVVGLVIGIIMLTSQMPTIATNLNTTQALITSYDASAGSLMSVNWLLLALLPLALIVGGLVVLFKKNG